MPLIELPGEPADSLAQKKQQGRPSRSNKCESTAANDTDASKTPKRRPEQSPKTEKGGAKSSKDTTTKKSSKNISPEEEINSEDVDGDSEDSEGFKSHDSQTPPMKRAKPKSNQAHADSTFQELEEPPKEAQTPSVVEAYFNPSSNRFGISGSTSNIISVFGPASIPSDYKPIYLPSHNAGGSSVEPLFIRPEHDILYLFLQKLDIPAFIARSENSVLQHLAFTWPAARGLRNFSSRLNAATLVRALKLKTIHILEGRFEGMEDEVDRANREFNLELVDMREGQAPPDISACWDPEDPPPPPADWVSGCLQELKTEIDGSSTMETRSDWKAPQIFGKEVRRTLVR